MLDKKDCARSGFFCTGQGGSLQKGEGPNSGSGNLTSEESSTNLADLEFAHILFFSV
jgi:hypothetical protein